MHSKIELRGMKTVCLNLPIIIRKIGNVELSTNLIDLIKQLSIFFNFPVAVGELQIKCFRQTSKLNSV